MKNFKFSTRLLMGAAVAVALSVSVTSCSDDDDDDKPGSNTGGGSTTPTITTTYIDSDTTWAGDMIHNLNSRTIVRNNATLTIGAGAIIKGAPGIEANAKPLIIAKGAKIMAQGTAAKPIIFTAASDNITVGQKTGTNLLKTDVGLWAGLIILGDAPISPSSGNTDRIEGIPIEIPEGVYGGSNATDNSGTLEYVSVRHGGVELVPGGGNEINGITFGGVGSGTTLDHVEVVANLDDGFEFFGGSVSASNLLVAYQGDDAYDLDQAYSGTISNFVSINTSSADSPFEIDGPEGIAVNPDTFKLMNGVVKNGGSNYAIFKSGAKGDFNNVYFFGFDASLTLNLLGSSANGNYTSGDLMIKNNIFNLPGSETISGIANSDQAGNTFGATLQSDNTTGTSAPAGFDKSQFTGWTWADANGELTGF